MAPVLYMVPYSQPVRATLMTIKALNIEIELQEVSLIDKQQLSSTFTKLNPQHTVPTLVEDDGFVLWESHAIMPYLVDKYGKEDDPLYPKDLRKRATINQRLHFNNGVLFTLNVLGPIIYQGEGTISEEKVSRVREAYAFLETFLDRHKWVAGDWVTIADFAIIATVTSLDVVVPVGEEIYPNVYAWMRRAEGLPYYDENRRGLEIIKNMVTKKLA
ncbi:hypothetical protein Zmor_008110 [Zophobas morio]|uniref:Uncharacterized protein n=2 Tax=Zophobas morio TaxID=2755281 RepID=A0AA38MPE8_9CUCU|nr:hypothetical protein Zmor_008110 [Zophobas morio]